MKLFPVCKVEILQVKVNKIEVLSFYVDFCRFSAIKIGYKCQK